jgi:pSer/pThr/pTyr-binding forkhead associated (FHA) protein
VYVEDTSTNGTFVDGVRVQKTRVAIKGGAELAFYKSEKEKIIFVFDDLLSTVSNSRKRANLDKGDPSDRLKSRAVRARRLIDFSQVGSTKLRKILVVGESHVVQHDFLTPLWCWFSAFATVKLVVEKKTGRPVRVMSGV